MAGRDDVSLLPDALVACADLMTSHRLLQPSLALLLVLTGSASLAAQGEPATVPTPLVMALLGMRQGPPSSVPRLIVGAPPAGWPAELVPHGMVPLGGTSQYGSLVAIFSDSTGQALGTFQRLLLASGFSRPTPAREEGFQSSGGPGDYFCRDSMVVTPTPIDSRATPRLLRVTYMPNSFMAERCFGAPTPERLEPHLKFPHLTPPSGAHQAEGSGSVGSGEVSTSATITDSTRGAADMARHYAAQLAAAGWTASPPMGNARVAVSALDARGAADVAWHGVLLIEKIGAEHKASITMNTERR